MGDQLALLGVQEDRPLVPRRIQSTFEFLDARHNAETPLGVGVRDLSQDDEVRVVTQTTGGDMPAPAASPGRCWTRKRVIVCREIVRNSGSARHPEVPASERERFR